MFLPSGAYGLFIDGTYTEGASGETFDVIDPSMGFAVAQVAKGGPEDIDHAVKAARRSFESGVWSRISPKERADVLDKIAKKVMEYAEQLALLEVQSSGATIRRVMSSDIMLVVDLFLQMANFTREFPHKEPLAAIPMPGPSHNFVIREPVGVCGAISPWNFPLILGCWKIAPGLAMGNSMVVKPASYTPLSTLLMGQICKEAGLPDGVLNIVPGAGSTAGEALASHIDVDKVAFTGSTVVGKRIMQLAAGTVKKVTLELGGKSPNIILEDADLDIAVPGSCFAFLLHNGQVCESGTRLLVPEKLHDEVIDRMVRVVQKLKVGNPLDMETDLGPVISAQQLETVLSYIEAGEKEGAKLVTGGKRLHPEGFEEGYYIEPTIFTGVRNTMRIAQEEIFGPVLSVIPYKNLDEAIQIANDTIYGLAGGVWTKDPKKALEVARAIKAGTVWINDWHLLRNDAPFGGYKQSGIGRELGHFGLEEYTQIKHIHHSMAQDRSRRFWYDRIVTLKEE